MSRLDCPFFARLARLLFNVGAVKFGEFRIKKHEQYPDAPLSPFYIDLRVLQSHPDLRHLVAFALAAVATDSKIGFNHLVPLPHAASSFGHIMSDILLMPALTPRREAKQRGTMAKIDGVFRSGEKVLMVDDVVTGAETKLEFAEIFRQAGLIVVGVEVLVDRESGGREQLLAQGLPCEAVFMWSDLLIFYHTQGLVDSATVGRCRNYPNDLRRYIESQQHQ